ncbi:Acetyltransferase (GNAT) family protein [Allokutzneria albata]|uniref:Acetyltransferase (GNAT) family protein n=2 Tax=Allokutzneria albata TaxID=211114 RepID=A0A1G9TPB8_ALLAB|nr:Acetyltransferase (GNAT) family protein [Allokutzneria albata]
MERAYAGTIDEDLGDSSDGAVEIAGWRESGAVGTASFVAVSNGRVPVAASLVSVRAGAEHWIAYVITDPAWKRRGLGRAVVTASLGVLADVAVFAGITDGNAASERLFTGLGFVRVGPA